MKRISKTQEDFAWTQWDAETIRRIAAEILVKKKEAYARIKAVPGAERTFENTVYAIENSGNLLVPYNYFEIHLNANPEESVRKAAEEAIRMIDKELVDVEYDEEVYKAFQEFADTKPTLEGPDAKLFKEMSLSYKRMGFHLPASQRETLKTNIKRLNELSTDFQLNIKNYKDNILVAKEELNGLPKAYIQGLKKDESGKYIVSLEYPELVPFLENATNADKRKELADKNFQKGGPKNVEIAKELLALRQADAKLLGYVHHADYVTERRMVKNGGNVTSFLKDFMERLQPLSDADFNDILAHKRKMAKDPAATLEYYDTSFYAKQMEKERFSIDSEKIREYFPLEHVMVQMLDMYGTLFSISFKKNDTFPLWHPDAVLYEVFSAENETIGHVFFDLFPRENKFGHAACWPIIGGRTNGYKGERYVSPVVGILANFNKPSTERPSLLDHGEVETLFHEFGHVLHSLLTEVPYNGLGGVAWDFVEVPSQLMEYWIWNKELLKKISRHHETGEPLSSEVMDNMLRSKYFLIAWVEMRQAVFSWFDILVHSGKWPDDLSHFYNELAKEHLHLDFPPNLFPAGMGHFVGYDAGYYSYLWSRVICADMFSRFKKEGLLNPKIGKEYKDKVLAVGGSRDEAETVKDFLGREFTEDAFLEEIGVKK